MPLRVAAITPKMKNGHNIVNLSPRTANEVLNYGFLGSSNMIEQSWVMLINPLMLYDTPKGGGHCFEHWNHQYICHFTTNFGEIGVYRHVFMVKGYDGAI